MNSNWLLYEHPLNELMRVCLRLEYLFTKTQHYLSATSEWDHLCLLDTLVKIIEVLDRPDCKSKFVQEIQRHQAKLEQLERLQQVDQNKLSSVLSQLDNINVYLQAQVGKLADNLRRNEFLYMVTQQNKNPGGICNGDAPAYQFWLNQPAALRMKDMLQWLEELSIIRQLVVLLLQLTRDNGSSRRETAEAGFYHEAIDRRQSFQLIRIALPGNSLVYPELSVGPHRLALRFIKHDAYNHAVQTQENIAFELICCANLPINIPARHFSELV
ncbi:MAG: uncharacterized protein K0R12_1148 [Gammaproteobacteria bacterium]|jgi:cell division protein ZapD|nr:uncharacterized protein [Gammaproteobacteria bacterium]